MNQLLYFPKNYYIPNYFAHRYFQIKGTEVVIPKPTGGGSTAIGPYTPAYDISQDDLFKLVKARTKGDELTLLIGKVLAKIEVNEDEEILLALINYTLQTSEDEEDTIELIQTVIELIEAIEDEERKQLEEDEKVLELIIENLFQD